MPDDMIKDYKTKDSKAIYIFLLSSVVTILKDQALNKEKKLLPETKIRTRKIMEVEGVMRLEAFY